MKDESNYPPHSLETPEPSKSLMKTILQEAQEIIYGDRERTYGHPAQNLKLIAAGWTLYLRQRAQIRFAPNEAALMDANTEITPEDVCWMMVELKKCREMNSHKRDNLTDACGYIALIDRINE